MIQNMLQRFHLTKMSMRVFVYFCLCVIVLGCVFRFWQINQSQFFFYDEGFYLNHNRLLGQIIRVRSPLSAEDFLQSLRAYLKTSLSSGKSLWFMAIDTRIFFGAVDQWFWARVISAWCGLLTLMAIYRFAARYFESPWVGWLSAALLAVLPSHVFYSHIGLQEALSTLLVLLGFYFYVFPRGLSWRTFIAGLFFGAAFFSNYRLIMLPVLIAAAELWLSFSEQRLPDIRKGVWCVVTFLVLVFGIGGTVFGGVNTYNIFAWVFHQQHMAQGDFYWVNFLTYPYNLFRLENGLFAVLFFSAPWLVVRNHQRRFLLPFVIAVVQMIFFSLPMENGARYICVVLPFVVMSAAYTAVGFFNNVTSRKKRMGLALIYGVMFVLLIAKSYQIAEIRSDYKSAVEFLKTKDSKVKFISSQKFVQDLYVFDPNDVAEMPRSFENLIALFSKGYRYLVIDPQVYVSYTDDEKRFSRQLIGFYQYIINHVEPLKVYDHFGRTMMTRHVMEHSTHLVSSVEFLRLSDERGYGKLYIYDLNVCIPAMMQALRYYHQQ